MKVSDVAALNTRVARGPRGLKGLKGEQGEQGLPGPQGLKGDKGDQGETASDELVKVSEQDEKAGFLSDKLQAGHGVNLSRRAGPAGEALFIDVQTGGPVGVRAFGGGGGGAHPNLGAHDALGLATDAELVAHAATPHGSAHPDLATHDTLGLATDAELSAAIAAAIAAHAATPHGSDIPPEIGFTA